MKINWLKVCTVGLEVLLAVGTGIAVFAGISKTINSNSQSNNANGGNQAGSNFTPPTVTNSTTPQANDNKIATGLRATQNSMEKIISVVGSLAIAAECIGSIFGKTTERGYSQMPWYGGCYSNNGWMTQTPPAYSGVGLRQVTPFVQEVGYYPSH